MKRCPKCGETKPFDEFYRNAKTRDGLECWCKPCRRRDYRLWYGRNREKVLARNRLFSRAYRAANREKIRVVRRALKIKRQYGLSVADWQSMFDDQGGRCAISGRLLDGGRGTHVDHDHETGLVRALLDGQINAALGAFEHNPEWLRRAADYIEKHQRKLRVVA